MVEGGGRREEERTWIRNINYLRNYCPSHPVLLQLTPSYNNDNIVQYNDKVFKYECSLENVKSVTYQNWFKFQKILSHHAF